MNRESEGLSIGLKHGEDIFYEFTGGFHAMPNIRKDVYFSRFDEYEKWHMQRDHVFTSYDMINDLIINGNYAEAIQLTGHMKTLMDLPINVYTLCYLASPLVVLNDEKIDSLSSVYEDKKRVLAKDNNEVTDFFLLKITSLSNGGKATQNYNQLSESLRNPTNRMISNLIYSQITQQLLQTNIT